MSIYISCLIYSHKIFLLAELEELLETEFRWCAQKRAVIQSVKHPKAAKLNVSKCNAVDPI